jgi:hypothetical protein
VPTAFNYLLRGLAHVTVEQWQIDLQRFVLDVVEPLEARVKAKPILGVQR